MALQRWPAQALARAPSRAGGGRRYRCRERFAPSLTGQLSQSVTGRPKAAAASTTSASPIAVAQTVRPVQKMSTVSGSVAPSASR